MNINFSTLDQLIAFLDTGKGVFWKDRAQVSEDRMIDLEFDIVNKAGETFHTTAHDVSGLAMLLSPIGVLSEGHNHPIVVLNTVCQGLFGVPVVGDLSTVDGFAVDLDETEMTISISSANQGIRKTTYPCGITSRIFVLRSFSEVDEGLAGGISAWPGKCRIVYDVSTGQIEILSSILTVDGEAESPAVAETAEAAPAPTKRKAPRAKKAPVATEVKPAPAATPAPDKKPRTRRAKKADTTGLAQ